LHSHIPSLISANPVALDALQAMSLLQLRRPGRMI
jgi:hypothetical protein